MTLVVVASYSYGDSPQVRLDVDSTPTGLLPVPDGSTVALYRVHEDGTRYRVITEVGARLVAGSWAGFDYHAPFNQPVTYVAVAAGQESAASGPQYVLSETAWLIHSSDPSLSVPIEKIVSIGDRTRQSNAAQIDVFGAPARFIKGSRRRGITGTLVIKVSPEDEQQVMDLIEDDTTLLLNTPGGIGWDLKWHWLQPRDETYKNPADMVAFPFRHVAFGYVVTDQPDVDLSPTWTCADVVAEFATCAAVLAAFATCEDLALDVR